MHRAHICTASAHPAKPYRRGKGAEDTSKLAGILRDAEASRREYEKSPYYPFSDARKKRSKLAFPPSPRDERIAAAKERAALMPTYKMDERISQLAKLKLNHKIINTKILRATTLEEVTALVDEYGDLMNFINIATAMTRARLRSERANSHQRRRHMLLRVLEQRMMQERDHWTAFGVVQCAYTTAKCSHTMRPKTCDAIVAFALEPSTAPAASRSQSRRSKSKAAMPKRTKSAKPGSQATASRAADQALADSADARTATAASSRLPRLAHFEPQGLALLLWAVTNHTVTNHAHSWQESHVTALLSAAAQKLATEELTRAAGWTPQALSLVALAFAKGSVPAPDVFDRVSAAVLQYDPAAFIPEQLANLAWAFAEAGHTDPALFEHLATATLPHATVDLPLDTTQFPAPALARIAGAYGIARHAEAPLFDALSDAAQAGNVLERLTPGEMTQLVWGFARTKHSDDALFNAVSKQIMDWYNDPSRNPGDVLLEDELSDLLWAYTESGRRDPELVSMIISELYA